MTRTLILLLSALCCCLAVNVELLRSKRGTRFYRVHCVDAETSAVRIFGDTWLRWRGQRVEYCRCALKGRERCHIVPVINCYVSQCYNGGTCKEAVYTSDYICQCPAGYSGTQCEINSNEKCIVGQGEGYRGTWSISHSGAQCINWNATSLRGRRFTARKVDASGLGLGNHNFCRNPDHDSTPWCYIYKGTQITWDFCSITKCPEDDYKECLRGSGRSYRGTASVAKSGSRCLPWDSPAVKHKLNNAWRSDALDKGLGSHSFCRNPDGDAGPWCHTYKSMQLTWELCDIPKCSRRPSISSTLGPRAPTTNNNNGVVGKTTRLKSPVVPHVRVVERTDIPEQPMAGGHKCFPRPSTESIFPPAEESLIDSCWVLSAAHCFEDNDKAEKLEVILGRTFRKQNSSSEQIFKVEKYWNHEKFHNETFDNDIALLKLKTDIGICAVNSPEVLPACLPERGLVLPDWTECEISGYGKDFEFAAEFSERVKRGFVRLWPKERCVPDVLSQRTITSNMLCAGDTRGLDDACKGDSGGPLVCRNNDKMTLMGVISWGDGCGQRDKPGVYTRVTHYIDWIKSKIKANPV
uniref:Plasminogen activator n=1 Tax=Gasterosteus aculeatus TaxID=69293 RepID=G3NJE0_GASAC